MFRQRQRDGGVRVYSPEDGGYPREEALLVEISPGHYEIRGLRECGVPGTQGGKSGTDEKSEKGGYFMVEASNPGPAPQSLTLTIPEHPPRFSYCYYRPPGGKWYRKHFDIDACSFSLRIEPGVTRIATVPYFTYGEYVDYVERLSDARLSKAVAITDEEGAFKVYRIRITNTTGVQNKLKICFAKSPHANESSGYFMAQGIIDWLLSGDPAANLDNIEWTFYPCVDPKAIHHHYKYREVEWQLYDGGRNGLETLYRDIGEGHHHIISIQHMWNNEHERLDLENYSYCDPFDGRDPYTADLSSWPPRELPGRRMTSPQHEPDSVVYRDYQAYLPFWFEYGTNQNRICNYCYKWPPYAEYLSGCYPGFRGEPEGEWKLQELEDGWMLETLGGGWLFYNEINFYGKDAGGDLIANIKEQGKQWARATSQVYLRFQREHGYWTPAHACGPVDLSGAVMLPLPRHILLETMNPGSGRANPGRNGRGNEMRIYHKKYDHGLGMKAGDEATFSIPEQANSFKANVAMDDAETAEDCEVRFVLKLDGKVIWSSDWLRKYSSTMAHVALPGRGELTLAVEGPRGALGNWGGARFTVHDPDMTAVG